MLELQLQLLESMCQNNLLHIRRAHNLHAFHKHYPLPGSHLNRLFGTGNRKLVHPHTSNVHFQEVYILIQKLVEYMQILWTKRVFLKLSLSTGIFSTGAKCQ